MKDGKITLRRAVNCYTEHRISDGRRAEESIGFARKNGFYFEDCWNLDYWFAYNILIRLTHYRSIMIGCPGHFIRPDEPDWKGYNRWKTIIDKMIRGFYLYVAVGYTEKTSKIIDKAMKLYSEHWKCIWE